MAQAVYSKCPKTHRFLEVSTGLSSWDQGETDHFSQCEKCESFAVQEDHLWESVGKDTLDSLCRTMDLRWEAKRHDRADLVQFDFISTISGETVENYAVGRTMDIVIHLETFHRGWIHHKYPQEEETEA